MRRLDLNVIFESVSNGRLDFQIHYSLLSWKRNMLNYHSLSSRVIKAAIKTTKFDLSFNAIHQIQYIVIEYWRQSNLDFVEHLQLRRQRAEAALKVRYKLP